MKEIKEPKNTRKICMYCRKPITYKSFCDSHPTTPKELLPSIWKRTRICSQECKTKHSYRNTVKTEDHFDEFKVCIWCEQKFYRFKNIAEFIWNRKKYCCPECQEQYKAAIILARTINVDLKVLRKEIITLYEKYNKE